MAKYKYIGNMDDSQIGKAVFRDVGISTKAAIEITSNIRNKPVDDAVKFLEAVVMQKTPVTYRRFTEGAGHKKGKIASGKYPVKAATEILKAIKSAESNAMDKGLSSNLKIVHIAAQKASAPWHYGRKRRRKMKRTTVEIFVKEIDNKKRTAQAETKPKIEEKVEKKEPEPKLKTEQPKEKAVSTVKADNAGDDNKESKKQPAKEDKQ